MMTELSLSDKIAVHASRLGPSGLSPFAPGTVGSAVAVLLAPIFFMPLPMWMRIAFIAVLFFWGSIQITRAEKILGSKDPGEIVLDELVGQWITILPFAALSFWWMVIAFFLFRVFDIAKPYPIRDSEKWLERGWGVMIDDVLAGLYAMVCLGVLRFLFA
ncbi:phosphatidylglycerophosphatase A family protein [Halodesulfovibrio marinisediminis]|uniref:Phosphatidylglycerophosphatase n=1 Tax=Halodesulfovibrio marinisediminis DSM 17456 TaxID=1121457 RepID=A0A1N6J3E7_9BACT|nr:phosphatidylglycerophosphatase A [Halodesulfovibrio marinisediminis]SIO38908.1 phosphatidylglycerophosphatase [Halodesulfovibrio marinisediminis DSM 17456]